MKKRDYFLLALWIFLVVSLVQVAIAQQTINFPPITNGIVQITNNLAPFNPVVGSFPDTKTEFWKWGISFATPLVVWLFGRIPALPRPVLPFLTPFIGIVFGLGLRKLGQLNLGWVDMGQAGLVAVALREGFNQAITKQLKPLEDSKTNTKPVDGAIAVAETTNTPSQPP